MGERTLGAMTQVRSSITECGFSSKRRRDEKGGRQLRSCTKTKKLMGTIRRITDIHLGRKHKTGQVLPEKSMQ